MRLHLMPLAGLVISACSGRIVVGDLQPASTAGNGTGSGTTTGGTNGGACVLVALKSTLEFGTVTLGAAETNPIQLHNAGTGSCIIREPSVIPNQSFDVQAQNLTQSFPLTLVAGTDLFLQVTFQPLSEVRRYSATLDIPYIDPANVGAGVSTLAVNLDATAVPNSSGCACQLQAIAAGGNFFTLPLRHPSEFVKQVSFTNTAQVDCHIDGVNVDTFYYSEGFGVGIGDGGIYPGATVKAFHPASLPVDFVESVPGIFAGYLTVRPEGAPGVTIALTATVLPDADAGANAPLCQIEVSNLSQYEIFVGAVAPNKPSASLPAVLHNNGVTECQVKAPVFLGGTPDAGADFAIADPDGGALFFDGRQSTSLPYPITLRPGEYLTQELSFAPALDAGCAQVYSELVVFPVVDSSGNPTFVPITLVGQFDPSGG